MRRYRPARFYGWMAAATAILSLGLAWTIASALIDVPPCRFDCRYNGSEGSVVYGMATIAFALPGLIIAGALGLLAAAGEEPRSMPKPQRRSRWLATARRRELGGSGEVRS